MNQQNISSTFCLPPYSRILNLYELVWEYLKHHKLGKMIITGPDRLKSKVYSIPRLSQKIPKNIKIFPHEPNVRYASQNVGSFLSLILNQIV